MPGTALAELAQVALSLVDAEPRDAARQAARVLGDARRSDDRAAAAVAGRAAGLAAVHLGRLDTAVSHLESAVSAGLAAGSPRLAAEAKMSLAFALGRRGDSVRAVSAVSAAIADLTGVARARALAQRGAIEQQLERLDPALADYRAALPALREAGEWVWVQRIHCNRAVLLIYRAQLAAAQADLAEAGRLCREHGLHLQLAFVTENLAFLHLRRGDVPAALRFLDEAERRHAELGARAGTVLLDRSELLLSVGLATEARAAAAGAVADLGRSYRHSARSQALLLLGEACLLEGDLPAARRAAARAIVAFRRQDRPEWVALAQQLSLRCRLAATGRVGLSGPALVRLADTLEEAGWALAALDTRVLAAAAAAQRGDRAYACTLLTRARPARHGSVEFRVRAWHAEALLRVVDGRPGAALAALRAGVRLVEDYQSTLGASDLRSSVCGHRAQLVEMGLGLCLRHCRARDVLSWAELGQATALLSRPVRPPDDPALAQRLVELRTTVAELAEARRERQPAETLQRRQAELECAVRDQARRVPGGRGRVSRPRIDELVTALGDRALVEYVEHDGQVHAVTLVDGRARLTALTSTGVVDELMDHLRLTLRRLTRTSAPAAGTAAAMRLLADLGDRLDGHLLAPLRRRLGDRPLVVVPSRSLYSVPWSLLTSNAGRPVTVSPSAALWHRAHCLPVRRTPVAVVAGPGLAAAQTEVRTVAEVYPGAEVLAGASATVPAAMRALAGAGTAHIAAHGDFRSDNALFSHLRLADGALTVYDLELLPQAPALVVLAACDGARTAISHGNEVLGLAAAFLGLGTRTLIASLVPIVDVAAAPLMVDLHRRLRGGESPAAALAALQRAALQGGSPAAAAAAVGLVCLGADHPPA